MNDWYIDRSRNFVNELLDPVLNYISNCMPDIKTEMLILGLKENEIFKESDGNPNAALTRFRDHGLIDNKNNIGESARDYLDGYLSRDELIIDLFIKRPSKKKNSADLKPLVAICKVFDIMFEFGIDIDDIYLSCKECFKYLYRINNLEEIDEQFVDKILSSRSLFGNDYQPNDTVSMNQNDITNLCIWFNALKNTTVFIGNNNEKTILRPNEFNRDFFTFISMYGNKMNATPTESNKFLYDYYCSRNKGINEIIPYTFNANVLFRDKEEVKIINDYLFGIKKTLDFDFSYYFNDDCFGIYHPFITMPRLVIRKINENNKSIGKMMYEYYK